MIGLIFYMFKLCLSPLWRMKGEDLKNLVPTLKASKISDKRQNTKTYFDMFIMETYVGSAKLDSYNQPHFNEASLRYQTIQKILVQTWPTWAIKF